MMPGETGFQRAKSLRESSAVPILMLTAKAETESRITGLELGADDYVPKPFEPRELSLRIANILKRTIPAPAPAIESARFGDFVFHLAGVNRPQLESEFVSGNLEFTERLCAPCDLRRCLRATEHKSRDRESRRRSLAAGL